MSIDVAVSAKVRILIAEGLMLEPEEITEREAGHQRVAVHPVSRQMQFRTYFECRIGGT